MTRAAIVLAAAFLLATVPAGRSGLAQPAADAVAAEQRIAALRAALQITPEQAQPWNSFADAMRDNAAATDALFRDRAANARFMTAADNMKSYAAVARAYADDTQKLSDAFAALYGGLSDRQKELADTVFRQQFLPPPPGATSRPGP